MKLNDLRQDYQGRLQRSELHNDPFIQFERWFEEARAANLLEPNAMSLATTGEDGQPTLRNVLLKHYDAKGFVFFTNKGSRKAIQIQENPKVGLMFSWLGLERQVIISGHAQELTRAETLRYFLLRPRDSQLGAWVSRQSKVIPSRQQLEDKFEEIKRRFTNNSVPLPKFWGGYRVQATRIEFWQGGAGRLHDRFEYQLSEEQRWQIERLSP